jgi:hypothetical protein
VNPLGSLFINNQARTLHLIGMQLALMCGLPSPYGHLLAIRVTRDGLEAVSGRSSYLNALTLSGLCGQSLLRIRIALRCLTTKKFSSKVPSLLLSSLSAALASHAKKRGPYSFTRLGARWRLLALGSALA